MNILKIIKYQLYLLQLENYELGRYFKLLFKKGFWPKGKQRKSLVWTMKARALFVLAFITYLALPLVIFFYFTKGLSVLSIKYYVLCGLLLTSYYLLLFLYFILYTLYILLLWPFDFLAKRLVITRAKFKISKLSNLKIIGIAGSYGKTTMKEVLKGVLGIRYKVLGTPDSINTPVGISRWILKNVNETTEIIIVEMGEHYRGDIEDICNITKPDISVVTGINESHMERMKSLDNIVRTIFEIVSGTKAGGMVILNADDERVMEHYKEFVWPDHRVAEYSARGESLPRRQAGAYGGKVSSIMYKVFDAEKLCWKIKIDENTDASVSLLGEYAVGDVGGAVKIAKSLGMTAEEIKKGIEQIKPVPHRLQPITSPGNILIIDDAYNGNPEGVREAIKVLSRFTNRRKVFITPGLVEMGLSSENVHRAIGKELAKVADVVVLIKNSVTPWIEEGLLGVSSRPLSRDPDWIPDTPRMHSGFRNDKPVIVWFKTAQQAHSSLSKILIPGDVVVFQNDWGDQYV